MTVVRAPYRPDARVLGTGVLDDVAHVDLGGGVVGDAKFPDGVKLRAHRSDSLAKKFRRCVVCRQEHRDHWLAPETLDVAADHQTVFDRQPVTLFHPACVEGAVHGAAQGWKGRRIGRCSRNLERRGGCRKQGEPTLGFLPLAPARGKLEPRRPAREPDGATYEMTCTGRHKSERSANRARQAP